MARTHTEDLLILTKTYPAPSTKYREVTCVAALNRSGVMRRLFPLPFRLLAGQHQFKKWEWIRANIIRAKSDQRPESYKIDVDTIVRLGERIGTQYNWAERRQWIEPQLMSNFLALEQRRQATGETLGFVRPSRLLALEIVPVKEADWTEEDKNKLLQEGLFDSTDAKSRPPLRKLPYDFYYRYECAGPDGVERWRHKLTDWEVGALYWNCFRTYGRQWEKAFRQRLETEFAQKDLMFLMGTMHRFPDQWLIVGLVYPPKAASVNKPPQLQLGL
ncbi:MAG: hypothetical protein HY872_06950 [Chloroflexi bacterium]|nr:hypothetical protein [Chloroflexota bacterium]